MDARFWTLSVLWNNCGYPMIKMVQDLPTRCSDYLKSSGKLLKLIFFQYVCMIAGFIWRLFWLLCHLSKSSCCRHLCSLFQDSLLLSSICWNCVPFPHIFGVSMLPGFTGIGFNLKGIRNKVHSSEEFLESHWSFCLRNQPKECLENTRLKTQNNCETEEKKY